MSLLTEILSGIRVELDQLDRTQFDNTPLAGALEALDTAVSTESGITTSVNLLAMRIAALVQALTDPDAPDAERSSAAALLSALRPTAEAVIEAADDSGLVAAAYKVVDDQATHISVQPVRNAEQQQARTITWSTAQGRTRDGHGMDVSAHTNGAGRD